MSVVRGWFHVILTSMFVLLYRLCPRTSRAWIVRYRRSSERPYHQCERCCEVVAQRHRSECRSRPGEAYVSEAPSWVSAADRVSDCVAIREGCLSHATHRLFAAVLDSGGHGGHASIVFDLCQSTLFDIAQGFCGLTPLPGRQVMEISYQILSGVACE